MTRLTLLSLLLSSALAASTADSGGTRLDAGAAAVDTLGSITGHVAGAGAEVGVAAAEVTLLPPERATFTAPNGAFAFHDVPAGDYELVVEHVGYGSATVEVSVGEGEATSVEVVLSARPYQLEPLEVTVRREYLESVGFYERRDDGWGDYLTSERLERAGLNNHARFRPEILLSISGFAGERLMSTRGCAGPAYYIDGRRNPTTESLMREFSAHEVGAVEVYPDGQGLPLFAMDPTAMKCGAVVIWTKRW